VRAEAGQFGTRCQSDFEGGWLTTLDYAYDRCDMFVDELDDSDTSLFNYTLKWGESGFSSDVDDGLVSKGGVDSVDLFFVNTHGGAMQKLSDGTVAPSPDARLALWKKKTRTFASTWRFGDNSDQARIFSQYACETLRIDDLAYGRWDQVFKGGLQLATGSHDKVYDGETTDEVGEDYADNLQSGMSVKWAWFDGLWDTFIDQDVAIYASSSGSLAECKLRRDWITWQNFDSFAQYRDNNMNRICASWITDY
jgi:hypothetical protein